MRHAILQAGLLAALVVSCGGDEAPSAYRGFNPGPTPDSLRHGEAIFNTYCASCHGRLGTGQGLGPPLLDTLFRAESMPDEAFFRAVELGVRQTHWHYGAMPMLKRVGRAEVAEIVPYVRWLQARVALVGTATGVR